MEKGKPVRVITGVVRLAYVNLFEPYSNGDNPPRYSVSLIIAKSDTATIASIQSAITRCRQLNAKFWGRHDLKTLAGGLKDGDLKKDPAYKNHYYINTSSASKPQIVNLNLQPIKHTKEVYSGCYARASILFYPYNNGPSQRGIGCQICNVQKIADGDPLGVISPQQDFSTWPATPTHEEIPQNDS